MLPGGVPSKWRDLPRCPWFGKIAHPTRASAVEHAQHITDRYRRHGIVAKVTVRQCGFCFAYHAGSRSKPRRH